MATITRINTFKARTGQGDSLRGKFAGIVPSIQATPGCLSCKLLQGVDDPDQIVVLEEWESVEAHQAAVKNIKPSDFAAVMPLLAERPSGTYFQG
jgi:quinol monooxygenase YgiN